MKKIIIITLIFSLLLVPIVFAISIGESEQYIEKTCYIRYYRYPSSNISIFDEVVGHIYDTIKTTQGYKFIIMDYSFEIKYILLDKIVYIKVIK